MLEVYVNGLANDMQQKLRQYGNIGVFTGVSLEQLTQAMVENRIQVPFIALVPLCGWANQQSYMTLSSNNQWIQRPFDLNTFPLIFGISARVFAADPQSAMNLGNMIINMYSNAITLGFQHPYFPQERIAISYTSGSLRSTPRFIQSLGIYVMEVEARKAEPAVPCFFNQNSFQLIGKDTFAEKELLSIAAVCSKYSSSFVEDLMQSKYRYLTSDQKLGKRETGKVSPSLKEMRKAYQKGTQIDSGAFCQEFGDLLYMIPDLYQRATTHEPYETTFAIFQNIANQYRAKRDWICDQLNIPPHLDLNIASSSQPREIASLTKMISAMVENEDMHVMDAYNVYLESAHEEAAMVDQMAAQAEQAVDFVAGLMNDHMEKKIGGLDLGNSAITGIAQDFLRNKFMK